MGNNDLIMCLTSQLCVGELVLDLEKQPMQVRSRQAFEQHLSRKSFLICLFGGDLDKQVYSLVFACSETAVSHGCLGTVFLRYSDTRCRLSRDHGRRLSPIDGVAERL